MEWTRSSKAKLATRLKALKPFDPYHSPLCTCGPKLTLNVYTGCGFDCLYCYTSTYSRGRWGRDSEAWGPRVNVVAHLERDLARLASDAALAPLRTLPVVLSLSSDPYPDSPRVSEAKLRLTRGCIERLAGAGYALLLQTKSDLVVRDLDLLSPGRAVVGLTLTTLDAGLAARLEPYAPSPERRLAALAEAGRRGVRTLCRIDPLLPGVNDAPESLRALLQRLAWVGVNQVVSSTFKMRRDSAVRFRRAFPEAAALSEPLYETKAQSGYRYLIERERRRRMEQLCALAHEAGLVFSCCREGMPGLNDVPCDGQHLLDPSPNISPV
jgi:DNA repair photolyase